ncbi:MAG TPA: Gfo/Idh/MocA family oxidoreductase, partial [Armatimonadota bacterium]|nr:Gfo/Idh/MocA family oxidoreductase [Armatimonadota bacterium]
MPAPLRLGIVGCSGHVGYVLGALGALADQVRLVAVAPGGPDEDLAALRAAPEAAGARAYDDYTAMLADAGLDLLAVTPHFYRHAAVSLAGLRHGCAVFCEKPLALTLHELDTLRGGQQSSGRPLGMMLDARYAPPFYTARRSVAAGVLGEVVAGYAQKSYKLGTRPDFYTRRATVGGLIPWVGIHAIDW